MSGSSAVRCEVLGKALGGYAVEFSSRGCYLSGAIVRLGDGKKVESVSLMRRSALRTALKANRVSDEAWRGVAREMAEDALNNRGPRPGVSVYGGRR